MQRPEARIQEAIEAMKIDKNCNLREAARDFDIPRTTLQRRVNETKTGNKSQEDRVN